MLTREMKDSGVEWIGEVPRDWEISTISREYSSRVEKVSDFQYKPLSVTKNGIVPQLENAAKSANHNDRKLVLKNDFVINSRSDRKMSSGVSVEDGSVSLINTVIYSDSILPEYSNYLLKNYSFAEEFYRWGTGIVADLWSTNWEKMKKIAIPVPQIDNQKKIVDVLESKVKVIDTILLNTQQSITELKKYKQSLITEAVTKGIDKDAEMKDSGVEWIGEMPSERMIYRVKNLFFLKGRIGWQGLTSNEYKTEGPHLVTGTDFKEGRINWKSTVRISEERFLEAPEIHIKNRDLLITKDGTIGKVAIVEDAPEKVSLNSGVLLIRCQKKQVIEIKYFYYILLSDLFWKWYRLNDLGASTIKHLYQGQFNNFSFPLPCKKEQQQIVDFLDEKTSRIDSLIKDKEEIFREYEEYKKSLIYEYVTGKKQV
ncbi:restriction endonuclease subunit S [Vagococcus fluvialis]|uniref:restriction endonuclease subunit S n=1 Tax=Vagococcus fluvialis TaxID=2738 RepID=UPI003B5CFB4D